MPITPTSRCQSFFYTSGKNQTQTPPVAISLSTIWENRCRSSSESHSSSRSLSDRASPVSNPKIAQNATRKLESLKSISKLVSDAVDSVQKFVLKTAILNSFKSGKPRNRSDLEISDISEKDALRIWRKITDEDTFHAVSDFIWDAGVNFWEKKLRQIDFKNKNILEKCILSAFIDHYGKELTLEKFIKNFGEFAATSSLAREFEVIDEVEHQILRTAIINSLYYSKIDINRYKINDLENITDDEVDFIWRDFSKSNYRCITQEFVENLSDDSLDKLMKRTKLLKDPDKVKIRLVEDLYHALLDHYGPNVTLEDLVHDLAKGRKSQRLSPNFLNLSDS